MAADKKPTDKKQSYEEMRKLLEPGLDQAEWGWLKPHLERNAVILVSRKLDLVEVGARMAIDESMAVQAWITAGLVGKPTEEQLELWNTHPDTPFSCLILQPYVLIQEKLLH